MSFILSWLLVDMSEREDRRNNRIRRNIMRRSHWEAFQMHERHFIKTFRLSKVLVESLILELTPYIPRERRSDALTIKDKVLVTLAFYASGSYQNVVGNSIYSAISQPTTSRAIRQVTKAMNSQNILRKYLVFPTTRESRDNIKRKFYDKCKMPGVIGCIDGTHVAIVKPALYEDRYVNRKGYHSLNVMLICDLDLNILCVDPSHPGSTHDSRVWSEHPLHEYMLNLYHNGETIYFLGDSGYPLRKTLMTPYLNAAEGSPEAHYYHTHVSTRNVVERCIGVLKARFRCLLVARKLHYDPTMAGEIVNACAVLHNIANQARIPAPELSQELVMQERASQYNAAEDSLRNQADNNINLSQENRPRRTNNDLVEGRMVQQALIDRLWIERP